MRKKTYLNKLDHLIINNIKKYFHLREKMIKVIKIQLNLCFVNFWGNTKGLVTKLKKNNL